LKLKDSADDEDITEKEIAQYNLKQEHDRIERNIEDLEG